MRPALLAFWLAAKLLSASEEQALLADAAERGDLGAVRDLVARRTDVNAAQADGMTALHWAAYREDLEAARLLVQAGANVKAANRYGVTPLSLACLNGNEALVRLLLDAGADPNATLRGGETALMTAARTGRPGPVRALLERGAAVDARESRSGQTALMWAAAEGHLEVVRLLIGAGADWRLRLDSGFNAWFFAVREGRLEVVRELLRAGANVNESFQPKRAARRGLPAGSTALHLAVENGHYELAAFLLDAGADPNASGPGYTPLHMITWIRRPNRGDDGELVPQGSGRMTSIEFVRKLVAAGADVNARMTRKLPILTRLNTQGATAFLLAARTADVELLRTLVELGADPSLANADNSTPLMAAAGLGTISPGEDPGTETEALEAVKMILQLGADVNAVDNYGETAMHGAAYKHFPAVVEFLALNGARIDVWNQKNRHGWTPLTIAEGHRFGNFKPSPETVAAFRRVMAKTN